MKRSLVLFFFLANSFWLVGQGLPKMFYSVDLNDRADDHFKVTLDVKSLGKDNDVFQFASTAPGTYQPMDIGRFVKDFKAFDKKGREISVEKLSVNQYKLSKAKKVKKITYRIEETWDSKVEGPQIYWMAGTSIEDDHVLINPHAVFGYIKGMKQSTFHIKLLYPKEWKAGTPLALTENGAYEAPDYDFLVDSPFLLGRLTKASTEIDGTEIDIYTYSKTDKIKSEDLLTAMSDMLNAANSFLDGFPIDHYTFLYHFEDRSWGAWEHSYSSEYILQETEFNEEFGQSVTDIAAHEFFHIVTPLNIHSEIIADFNFVEPVASRHLWLYEGTTEWASHMMQYREGLTTDEQYFAMLKRKVMVDKTYFDPSWSLERLSLESYSPAGQAQYGNIYYRGALVAGLLDIRLLELSGGKRGLREVMQELASKFGKEKAFSDEQFFDTFTELTYPEIGQFLKQYVQNAEPLPIKEYYAKIGVDYYDEVNTGDTTSLIGISFDQNEDGQFVLKEVVDGLKSFGVEANDILKAIDGEELNSENLGEVFKEIKSKPIGAQYSMTVIRDGEEKTFDVELLGDVTRLKYVFSLREDATPEQKALLKAWKKNLN